MATEQPTNPGSASQLTAAELDELCGRLRAHADKIESIIARPLVDDLLLASRAIEQLIGTSAFTDLLVDITDQDGNTKRNVSLREAIGDDAEEYEDCRKTLRADGRCTTGGGAAPLYHLMLVRNQIVVSIRGGTIDDVQGIAPGASVVIRDYDVEGSTETDHDDNGEPCFISRWPADATGGE